MVIKPILDVVQLFSIQRTRLFLQDGEESVASWELRVEGRLMEEV